MDVFLYVCIGLNVSTIGKERFYENVEKKRTNPNKQKTAFVNFIYLKKKKQK